MKIDLSGLKSILGKIGAVRSFSSLVLPMVILLVGVLVLAGALVMGSSFRAKVMKESVSLGRQVSGLVDNVPAAGQVDEEKRYMAAYESDANMLEQLVNQTTMRPLLRYGMFPSPQDTSTLIFNEFGRSFCKAIEDMIADVNGRDCPSVEEIDRATNKSTAGQARVRSTYRMATSGADAPIVDALCREKAEAARVYVNPSSIAGYDYWVNYKYTNMDDGLKDCWYWQTGNWIIEDVFAAIKVMNEGSVNVYTSPFKRLVTVTFAADERGPVSRGYGATRTPSKKPVYVIAGKNLMAQTPTGRVTNDELDVVHFNVTAIVGAESVGRWMAEICAGKPHTFKGWDGTDVPKQYKHNQITILEYKIKSIDRESNAHSLFRYGNERYRDDAVVEVDMVCEYVFRKAVYDAVKPEIVKTEQATAGSTR